MEPAHIGIASRQGQGQAGRDIFWETGVVAGGEGQLPFHTDTPRRQTNWAFCGDVNSFRFEGLEPFLYRLIGPHRDLDFGIGGQGEGLELVWADNLDRMTHLTHFSDHAG